MTLRLITGRAGSGKSRLCLAEVAARLRQDPLAAGLVLLVPEQATFGAEWALATEFGLQGSLGRQVYSFGKLFAATRPAAQPALPWLDEMGKSMLLQQLLNRHWQELQVFGKAGKYQGFLDRLQEMMTELQRYQVSLEQLQQVKDHLQDDFLAQKLSDLTLLYQDYQAALQGRYWDDTLLLEELAKQIPAAAWLKQATVWVDGYREFTPVQMKVLAALLQTVPEMTVALCADDIAAGKQLPVFADAEKTYGQLCHLARQQGIPVETVHLLENYRHQSRTDLKKVEAVFAGADRQMTTTKPQHVQVLETTDPREELAFVARECWRLCREEQYRFADIAIITRNLPDYQEIIDEVLADYDIPYFMDLAEPLGQHPLLELLQSALTVIEEKWQHMAVMRYCKTGFVPVEQEDLDELENYVLANGIRGSQWRNIDQWQKCYQNGKNLLLSEETRAEAEAYLEQMKAAAWQGTAALQRLASELAAVKGKYTVSQLVEACRQLCLDLQVQEVLQHWQEEAVLAGRLQEAAAHQQIAEQVDSLLQQLTDFLGTQTVTIPQFLELLQSGSRQLTLHFVPQAVDALTVADIKHSRLPNIKVAFVVGCNEGIFPLRLSEDQLLHSRERELLAKAGLHLAASQRQQQFTEEYHIYMAMTRSSEKLYLSYAASSCNGEALKPSLLLAKLQRLFPYLLVQKPEDLPQEIYLTPGETSLAALSEQLLLANSDAPLSPFWQQVYQYFDQRQVAPLQAIQRGLSYHSDQSKLEAALYTALYGELKHTSVSRLELFNQCPCRYFARYGLKLEPRQEFAMRTLDIGLVYHYILAEVLQELVEEGVDWGALPIDALQPRIETVMEAYLQQGLAAILSDTGKNSYFKQKILQVVSRSLLQICQQLACGSFIPVGWEMSFGSGQEVAGMPVALADGTTVEIRGQIDRVDRAQGNHTYYRILDYKMANKNLTLSDLYYGLNWQLPVYLRTLLRSEQKRQQQPGQIRPAGMFYISVRETIQSVLTANETPQQDLKLHGLAVLDLEAVGLAEPQLAANGGAAQTMRLRIKKDGSFGKTNQGITPEEYDLLQDYIGWQLQQQLMALKGGVIGQAPLCKENKLVCEYCDYHSLCGLDQALTDTIRQAPALSKEEVLTRLSHWQSEQNQEVE